MTTCEHCTPIACDLTAFTPEERAAHEALLARVRAGATSVIELEKGFRFTFSRTSSALPDFASDVARWMVYEQKCCPFFELDLTLEKGGALSLSIRGPEEAKAILRDALAAK